MSKEEKQKQIDKIEYRINLLALKAKWNKLSIIETIMLAQEVVGLAFRARVIQAQPIPR